jgi:hypothetical protein
VATDYYLFPDGREEPKNILQGHAQTGAHNTADEVLPRLRRIDWAHPALLVYREEGEDRWSQVLLGLNKPEFGEEDA